MTLRADYPNWQLRALEARANLEVTVGLEEREEPDLRLLVDSFQDEVVAHVLVSVEHVGSRLAYEDDVDQLLGCVAMLGQKRVLLHVHIIHDVLKASC